MICSENESTVRYVVNRTEESKKIKCIGKEEKRKYEKKVNSLLCVQDRENKFWLNSWWFSVSKKLQPSQW